MTQMIDLTSEGIKTDIVNMFHMINKVAKPCTRLRTEMVLVILIKLLKIAGKGKILKIAREKRHISAEGKIITD